jgi:hypothetical protein
MPSLTVHLVIPSVSENQLFLLKYKLVDRKKKEKKMNMCETIIIHIGNEVSYNSSYRRGRVHYK